jgi:hypothetical protein
MAPQAEISRTELENGLILFRFEMKTGFMKSNEASLCKSTVFL